MIVIGNLYNLFKYIVWDAYCILMSNMSTIISINCCFCSSVIVYALVLLLALYNILIVTVVIG